ncbi:MAG: LacI family DNA-binding transcriptional regulator, partial [Trebonia sp.]
MAVSLRDVAALAGVSVKTVSNVVNGYVHVAADTRARVEAAVAELGYRPNLSARNLRGGRSGVIAFAVPEIGVPYFAELAQEVVATAGSHGLTVLIDQTEGRVDREQQVLEGIRAHLIDGLIFSPLAVGQLEIAQRTDTTPLVLLGERDSGGMADHVAIDNVAAAREAVIHLTRLG